MQRIISGENAETSKRSELNKEGKSIESQDNLKSRSCRLEIVLSTVPPAIASSLSFSRSRERKVEKQKSISSSRKKVILKNKKNQRK